MPEILRFSAGIIVGILIICAGIFRWKFPTIRWNLRETKYGEEINTIAMIIWGISIIALGIQAFSC